MTIYSILLGAGGLLFRKPDTTLRVRGSIAGDTGGRTQTTIHLIRDSVGHTVSFSVSLGLVTVVEALPALNDLLCLVVDQWASEKDPG